MLDWSAHQLSKQSKINRMMLIQWISDAHQSRCIEPHKWIRIKFDKFQNKVGVENIANGVRCRSNATYQKRSNGMTRVASILLQLIFPINKTYVIQNLNFRLNRIIFLRCYVSISSSLPDDDVEIATKEKNSICVSANAFILNRRSIFLTFVERNAVHFQLIGICVWCLYFHT